MYGIVHYAQSHRHWVKLGTVPTIEATQARIITTTPGMEYKMDTLKALAGKSIVTVLTAYSLLLVLFPVGWIILLGTLIRKPSMDKRSIETRILGADLEV